MALDSVPSVSEAQEARRQGEAQDAFWKEHHRELLEKYPEQFIAVVDGQVVASNPDLLGLVALLREKGLEVPSSRVWTWFVSKEPRHPGP